MSYFESKRRKGGLEERENPKDYTLTIVIHRHSEKESHDGDLTPRGRETSADYFTEAYQGVLLDLPEGQGVEIHHSPIGRTKDTAYIAAKNYNGNVGMIKEEPRIIEANIISDEELLETLGGKGGKWIPKWMAMTEQPREGIKTGTQVARDFAEYIVEQIKQTQVKGGKREIDTFSHFPAMAAFLLTLEKWIGKKVLPDEPQERLIRYLESFNIFGNSQDREHVQLQFRGKVVTVPIKVLEEIAGKKSKCTSYD